jgi:hypothetical protein
MNKLKKRLAFALAGILVLIVAFVWGSRIVYKRAYRTETYSWTPFASQDGGFNISLPGNPTTGSVENKASDGGTFILSRVQSIPVPGVIYAISWWENSGQRTRSDEEFFRDAEECAFKAFRGGGSWKDTTVQGHPARLAAIFGPNEMVEGLLVRVGPRVYSLSVVDSTSRFDVDNIKKFFGSLSLSQPKVNK